jgi:hypothetical protein
MKQKSIIKKMDENKICKQVETGDKSYLAELTSVIELTLPETALKN